MGLLYSISFLMGNFLGIGRLVHLLMSIRHKRIEWLAIFLLIWLQLSPAVTLFFLFNSQWNWIQHVVVIVVAFSVGFKWTSFLTPITNEFEKIILEESKTKKIKRKEDIEKINLWQLLRNCLLGISLYFQKLYNRIFPYQAWLKRAKFYLPQKKDARAVKIFEELKQEIGVLNVILCIYDNDKNVGGYAILKPRFAKKNSFILISSYASEKLSYDELRALIAHELMHIHNKDYYSNDSLFSLGAIYISIFLMMLYIFFIDHISKLLPFLAMTLLIPLPILLIFFMIILFYFLYGKQGYWFQIRELRADRKSCMLSGNMCEGMLSLLERLKVQETIETSDLLWFQKYYLKYNSWHSHPSVDYRIKMIQNYKQWSYRDYFIHFLQTIKWAVLGKGWSGS